MKKILLRLGGWILVLPVLVSCNANVFSFLGSDNTDEDHREVAIGCLQNGDYACAVKEYSQLSNPVEVAQSTCTTLITEAGLTINTLVTTLSPSSSGTHSSTALGDLAQQLLPWNQTKATAVSQALGTTAAPGPCANFHTLSPGTLSSLLNAAAVFVDAGLRLARTTVQVGNAETDTVCNTPPVDTSGNVTKAGVGGDPTTGAISAAQPGLCPSDAAGILTDFTSLNILVQDPQLQSLASTYNNLVTAHPELKDSTTANKTVRLAVKSFIAK